MRFYASILLALLAQIPAGLADDSRATTGSDPKAEAQRGARSGTEDWERGDYLVALEEFRRAYALYPSPNLRFNMGRVLSDLGRELEALEAFEEFLATATNAPADAIGFASSRVRVLRARVGQLNLRCDAPGARVFVDGKIAGLGPLELPVRLMPGSHMIGSELVGYQSFMQTIDVQPGAIREVRITLVKPIQPKPFYKKAWFWGTVGGMVAAAAATSIALGIVYGTKDPHVALTAAPNASGLK